MFFKVLFTGEHTNHDLGNKYKISPLTSSVAYLDDGVGNKILFDTGSLTWKNKLLNELKIINVEPDQITHVLLTHFHLDHTANCVLFNNAQIHANRSVIDNKTGECTIYKDYNDKKLPANILVIPTPGHTADHVSYFFTIDNIKYCFAGDAIREDTILEGGAPHYFEQTRKIEFKNSALEIFENCDVIIPGHFGLIQAEYKKKLYNHFAK